MAGAIYARYNYDAWGNTISITKLNGDAILPSATEIAYLNPIRAMGTLISLGVPAPILKASKVVVSGATSVAHSINRGDSVGGTIAKAAGSMAFSAVSSRSKPRAPQHYTKRPAQHYRAPSVLKQVVQNRVNRGLGRMTLSGLGRLYAQSPIGGMIASAFTYAQKYIYQN